MAFGLFDVIWRDSLIPGLGLKGYMLLRMAKVVDLSATWYSGTSLLLGLI